MAGIEEVEATQGVSLGIDDQASGNLDFLFEAIYCHRDVCCHQVCQGELGGLREWGMRVARTKDQAAPEEDPARPSSHRRIQCRRGSFYYLN